MSKDVKGRSTCTRSKSSNMRPVGRLYPLPVPSHIWPHVSIYFVTGLPEADGMTTIATFVDRFSMAAHLVTLPSLPSTKETAKLFLAHVVRLHEFPVDAVSDLGPQFSSKFWKAICVLVGKSRSMSSAFHLESNAQDRTGQSAGGQIPKMFCFLSSRLLALSSAPG